MADAFTTLIALAPTMAELAEDYDAGASRLERPGSKNSIYQELRNRDVNAGRSSGPPSPGPAAPLLSPDSMTATATTDQIQLTWSAVAGATSYIILWTTTFNLDFSTWNQIPVGNVTSYLTGHFDLGRYFFSVRAVNSDAVAGSPADPVQVLVSYVAPPPAPAHVVLQTWLYSGMFAWWETVPGATSYAVYYSITPGQGRSGTRVVRPSNWFSLGGLFSGTYYITVAALSGSVEGALSVESSIFVQNVALAIAPPATTANPGAQVQFSASGGAGSYVFDLSQNQSGGNVNPSTGLYTAGAVDPSNDIVRVTDRLGVNVTAPVTVTADPFTQIPMSGLIYALDSTSGLSGTTWTDRLSPYATHLSGIGARIATYNGLTVFRSDGANALTLANLSIAGPHTVCVVDRYNGLGGNARGRNLSAGNANNWLLGFWANNSGMFHPMGGWVSPSSNSAAGDNGWYMTFGMGDGNTSNTYKCYRAASDATSATYGVGPPGTMSLGGWTSGAEYSNADTSLVLVWNRILTPAEVAQVYNAYKKRFSMGRYWRLYITAAGANNYCSFTELELRSDVGAADLTSPTTNITASSSYPGYPVTNLIDNNVNDLWSSTQGGPWWVQIDFGAGVTKSIREIAMSARGDAPTEAPQTFDVQASDDGVNWVTLASVNWGPFSSLQTRTISW